MTKQRKFRSKTVQDKQIEEIKKSYNELSKQREKEFGQKFQQMLFSHKKELDERGKQLQLMQQRESQFKSEAIAEARAAARIEIMQRDQQIRRFKEKIESLESQADRAYL
jgi:hypothetical protein